METTQQIEDPKTQTKTEGGSSENEAAIDTNIEGEERLKKKKRCSAWDHFVKLPLEKDGKRRAKCNYCSGKIVCDCKSGTSGLTRHLDSCTLNPNRVDNQVETSFFWDYSSGVF